MLRCNGFHVSLALVVDENPGGEHGREGQLTDRIGLGVLTRLVHRDLVDEVLADTADNEDEFGRGVSLGLDAPYPKVKVLGLGECGTHAVIDAHLGGVLVDQRELGRPLLASIEPGMLVLADRGFYSRAFWGKPSPPAGSCCGGCSPH